MTDRIPVIVFAGDSITDAGRREPATAPFGRGYVARLANPLGEDGWQIVNAGVGGDRVRDLTTRWADDVASHKPAVVSVLIGINDVWRGVRDNDPTTAEAFESTYREILQSQNARGDVRWILLEPFHLPIHDDHSDWAEDLEGKQRAVKLLAEEFGATLVPLHELLNADAVRLGIETLTEDGVHLTAQGHERLAMHWRAHTGL